TVVGHTTVKDLCMSVPPGNIRPRFTYSSAASVYDKVAYEMAASAEAFANGEISNSLPILPSSSGASPQALTAVHRLLAESGVPRAKAIGYRGLLMQNNRNALEEVERQAASLTQGNSGALIAAAISEHYRSADPLGVAALGRMATGDQSGRMPDLKNAAARALAWIHTATFGLFEIEVWWELASLITIMVLGHWLEMRAIAQASGALNALAALLPDTIERVTGAGTETVPLSELNLG